jgi:hypothetical protein
MPRENLAESVQSAYAASFPQIKKAVEELHSLNQHPQMKDHLGKLGGAGAINWQDLAGRLSGEFCKDWPILKKAVTFVQSIQSIPFLSFIAPQLAAALALVSPVIGMVDKIYPQICSTPTTT